MAGKYEGLGQNTKTQYAQPRKGFTQLKRLVKLESRKTGTPPYSEEQSRETSERIREKYHWGAADYLQGFLRVGILFAILLLIYTLIQSLIEQ